MIPLLLPIGDDGSGRRFREVISIHGSNPQGGLCRQVHVCYGRAVWVSSFGFRVPGSGFCPWRCDSHAARACVSGLGFRVLGFRVHCSGLRVLG